MCRFFVWNVFSRKSPKIRLECSLRRFLIETFLTEMAELWWNWACRQLVLSFRMPQASTKLDFRSISRRQNVNFHLGWFGSIISLPSKRKMLVARCKLVSPSPCRNDIYHRAYLMAASKTNYSIPKSIRTESCCTATTTPWQLNLQLFINHVSHFIIAGEIEAREPATKSHRDMEIVCDVCLAFCTDRDSSAVDGDGGAGPKQQASWLCFDRLLVSNGIFTRNRRVISFYQFFLAAIRPSRPLMNIQLKCFCRFKRE